MPYYSRIEWQKKTVEVYSFHCAVGNHEVYRSEYPPGRCQFCHRSYCRGHHKRYFVCKSCWDTLTPEQRTEARQSFWKTMGNVFGLIIAILALFAVAVVPPIIWFRDNSVIFYIWLIGGLALVAGGLISAMFRYGKKKGIMTKTFLEELREIKVEPLDKKSKKILILVLIFMGSMVLLIIIIASIIMAQFNARWD